MSEIKFDHFKNIEELIQHLEMWYAADDYFAYDRYFHLDDARKMGMYIYKQHQEIERLNNQIKEYGDLDNHNKSLYEENKRLNKIINKLEEFIEKKIDLYTVELTEKNKNKLGYTAPIRAVYKEIYNVLQELKGSDKE